MATKEEILEKIAQTKKNMAKGVAASYQYDEGEQLFLDKPEQDLEKIDQLLISHLISGITDETAFEFASLLYFRTFATLPKEKYDAITGSVFIDRNLYSEDKANENTNNASAAYTPNTNDIFLRLDFLSGSPSTQANDIVSMLHETKHYFQFILNPMFKRHMGKEDEGSSSQHDLLVKAFKGFGAKNLFPNASPQELGDLSYALYHQNPIEVEAREYSIQVTHDLITRALATEDLPAERATYLEEMLRKVNLLNVQNTVENLQFSRVYGDIQGKVEEKASEVLSQREEILSPDNIVKLEHYDEDDKETSDIKQYVLNLENALLVQYDEDAAYTVAYICTNYHMAGVGTCLVQNPNFQPTQDVIDSTIGRNPLIKMGMNPIPCYPSAEVVDRYAELNADPVQ